MHPRYAALGTRVRSGCDLNPRHTFNLVTVLRFRDV